MKKLIYTALALLLLSHVAMAQSNGKKRGTITGTLYGGENAEPLMAAQLQLYLLPDTVYTAGAVTNEKGAFRLSAPEGKYQLRISFVGYVTRQSEIAVKKNKTTDLGNIMLKEDVEMLEQAEVTAEAPPVVMVEDTTVYNTSAFRVPAGSMLEDLIKKYPGVEIGDDGSITINGKKVTRILMKGKDFFGTDKDVALKNVPVDVVDKVKFYDKQSDFSRVTGIDDGEEEAVLDLQMKKGADQGLFGNVDVAYGSKERYSAKNMTNYFTSSKQLSLVLSANNVGDRGFSRGRGGSGLSAPKNAGFNFATTSNKLETGGHINWRHNDTDSRNYSSTEYFVTSGNGNQYLNSRSTSFGRSMGINGNFRMEWKPDTLTNIIFTPSVSYSSSDNWSRSMSATFSADPFGQGADYPLSQFGSVPGELEAIAVNRNNNESMSTSERKTFGGNLQINRRLGKPGRNITLSGGFSYSDSESKSLSQNEVRYYQASAGGDGYNRRRFSVTPNTNWNYDVRLSYTEPIKNNLFLQLSYRFNYSYSNSDRSTYVFDNTDYEFALNSNYRFPAMPDDYKDFLSDDQSRFSIYRNMRHEAQLMFRYVTEKMNMSAGVTWMPQNSRMSYKYLGLDTVLRRTVHNITPNVRLRYRWDKNTSLMVTYRGSTSQPSMTDMLDVTDDSDPLNISKGNPGLKPAFTHRFNANFRAYNTETKRNINVYAGYNITQNSISSKVTYNEATGGRVVQPENINGNYSMNGGFGYNAPFSWNEKFTYSTNSSVNYNHQVSYVSLNRNSSSERNTTRTVNLGEHLKFGYRSDLFDIDLNGSVNYSHSKNRLQPDANLDTWNFSYGPSGSINLPWQNMQISTDISMSSRRGFSDPTFNTNELLWNAQVSLSFLERNALTVSFQLYDILQEQSNISRSINAYMRRDSQTNAINSYCLLHVIYKFNQMGDKETRERMRNMRGMRGYGGDVPMGPRGFGGSGGPGGLF